MPDALEERLRSDARSDDPTPPSFDVALDRVAGRPRRAWLMAAAAAVLVAGAATALALSRSGHDPAQPAGHPTATSAQPGRVPIEPGSRALGNFAHDPRLLRLSLGECARAVSVNATETASTVTVRMTGIKLSTATDGSCPHGDDGALTVRLAAPIGDRTVRDALSGYDLDVVDLDDTPTFHPLPAGYRQVLGSVRALYDKNNRVFAVGSDGQWSTKTGLLINTSDEAKFIDDVRARRAGTVAGAPARIFAAYIPSDAVHPQDAAATCVTWTVLRDGRHWTRILCATASAFTDTQLLALARSYH